MLNILEACGLDNTQSLVLVFLLESGPRPAAQIAQRIKKKRSTVYSALERLEELNLVSKEKKESTSVFGASPIDVILSSFKNSAQKNYHLLTAAADLLSAQLSKFESSAKNTIDSKLKVRLISTTEKYKKTLASYIAGDYRAIWDPAAWMQNKRIEKEMYDFLKKSEKKPIKIQVILAANATNRKYAKKILNPNHCAKFLKLPSPQFSDIVIGSNSILISLFQNNTEGGIEIFNNHFYSLISSLFDSVWSLLPD